MHLSRIAFAKPYLLKAGQTVTVTLPKLSACPFGSCASACSLVSGIATVTKNDGPEIGDVFSDYTVTSAGWRATYTATEDTYIVVYVKYDKHGGNAFTIANPLVQEIVVTVK